MADGLEAEFAGLMQEMASISGMDRAMGALLAYIYIEPGEIALEDIARKAGCSLSSASTKVNVLERMGLISKRRHPGDRKIYVYMEKNFDRIVGEEVMARHRRKFSLARERLPALIAKYGRNPGKDDRRKVEIMRNYLSQLMRVESAIERMINALREGQGAANGKEE